MNSDIKFAEDKHDKEPQCLSSTLWELKTNDKLFNELNLAESILEISAGVNVVYSITLPATLNVLKFIDHMNHPITYTLNYLDTEGTILRTLSAEANLSNVSNFELFRDTGWGFSRADLVVRINFIPLPRKKLD